MITHINGKKIDFYQLMDHSISAKFIIKDKKIVYANKKCLQLLKGEKPGDILNKNIDLFLHSDYHQFSEKRLEQVITNEQTLEPVELKIVDFLGDTLDVETVAGPIYVEDDIYIQVTITDITDRKRTQDLLVQTEKLSVVGELAAGIIHEIRNPLTIVSGFLDLMDGETSKKGKEYVAIMKKEVERIEIIANDLLLFSKPNPQKFENKNIVRIVNSVVQLMEGSRLRNNITIETTFKEQYIEVHCDEIRLKQVFINLIKNAMEATPTGGNIKVGVSKDIGKDVTVITIADTGCGMSKEKLSRLGTSFFTTKEEGTGLGLMVSYNIIKSHKGKISVDSVENVGTTFSIEIPHENQWSRQS